MTLREAACASTFSNPNKLPAYKYDPKHYDKKKADKGDNCWCHVRQNAYRRMSFCDQQMIVINK